MFRPVRVSLRVGPFGFRLGNPAVSTVVAHYLAFSHREQSKSGITPKQAPVLLRPDLRTLLVSIRNHLNTESTPTGGIALVGDNALFFVVFQTGRRGDDLHGALGGDVLKLPRSRGLILNFPFGKALRPYVRGERRPYRSALIRYSRLCVR